MRFASLLLLVAAAGLAWAHAVSLSSSTLVLNGRHAHFSLRIPLFEVAHVFDPATTLLKQFRFASGGHDAEWTSQTCQPDRGHDQYACEADLTFSAPVDQLEASCRLAQVLVPNHVHLLRVESGTRSGQAAFDARFTTMPVDLREQTPWTRSLDAFASGVLAIVSQVGLWVILFALALAARTRRELLIFVALLAAGEFIILLSRTDYLWKISPYFIEAALALTMAYLAGEMVFFRHTGERWVVVALLAVWLGCYLKVNYAASGQTATGLLIGFCLAQFSILAVLCGGLWWARRSRWRLQWRQPSAIMLMLIGLGWFFWRWWSA